MALSSGGADSEGGRSNAARLSSATLCFPTVRPLHGVTYLFFLAVLGTGKAWNIDSRTETGQIIRGNTVGLFRKVPSNEILQQPFRQEYQVDSLTNGAVAASGARHIVHATPNFIVGVCHRNR